MELQLPQAFIEKVQVLYGERSHEVLQSLSEKRHQTFRVNTLHSNETIVLGELKKHGISPQPVEAIVNAYMLDEFDAIKLKGLPLMQTGDIYFQSLSSMLPPLILDPQDNEYILDMAAAPGSKTTQLASLMHNSGTIIANDISRERLFKLKAVLEQYGVTNTELLNMPGEDVWKKFPEYFDRVLVDVPCSMEGRFVSDDPRTFRDWKPKKVKILAKKQGYLLRSALSAAKVGGTIVYSTCTLSPEENEGVIDWILAKCQESIIVEDIAVDVPRFPAVLQWQGKQYIKEIANTFRVIPSIQYEGFFVAKLKKIRSTLPA